MTPSRPHVTESELAVLEVLWDEQPSTIRAITDQLYPDGGTSAYATVQKLLERLESKGFVSRQRRTVPHRFRSRIDRGGLIDRRLRDLADTLCEGSLAPLLTQLLGGDDLSDAEVDELRDMVRELRRKRQGGDR